MQSKTTGTKGTGGAATSLLGLKRPQP